jgi:hypothetical protein
MGSNADGGGCSRGREALRLRLPVVSPNTRTHTRSDPKQHQKGAGKHSSAWGRQRTLMRDVRMEPTGASVLRYLCRERGGEAGMSNG